jgi:hypothetical protein
LTNPKQIAALENSQSIFWLFPQIKGLFIVAIQKMVFFNGKGII